MGSQGPLEALSRSKGSKIKADKGNAYIQYTVDFLARCVLSVRVRTSKCGEVRGGAGREVSAESRITTMNIF